MPKRTVISIVICFLLSIGLIAYVAKQLVSMTRIQKAKQLKEIGILELNSGKKQALTDLDQSLRLNPEDPETLFELGVVHQKSRQYDEALSYFFRALHLKPNDPQTLWGIGYCDFKLNNYLPAIDAYQKALEYGLKDPRLYEAYNELGACYLATRRNDQAEKAFLHALRLQPSNTHSLNGLGDTYYARNDLKKGLSYFRRAAESHGTSNQSHYAFDRMGDIYYDQHQYPAAIDAFKSAIRADPKADNTYYELGVVYEKIGDTNEARKAYRTAIRLNPGVRRYTIQLRRLG